MNKYSRRKSDKKFLRLITIEEFSSLIISACGATLRQGLICSWMLQADWVRLFTDGDDVGGGSDDEEDGGGGGGGRLVVSMLQEWIFFF